MRTLFHSQMKRHRRLSSFKHSKPLRRAAAKHYYPAVRLWSSCAAGTLWTQKIYAKNLSNTSFFSIYYQLLQTEYSWHIAGKLMKLIAPLYAVREDMAVLVNTKMSFHLFPSKIIRIRKHIFGEKQLVIAIPVWKWSGQIWHFWWATGSQMKAFFRKPGRICKLCTFKCVNNNQLEINKSWKSLILFEGVEDIWDRETCSGKTNLTSVFKACQSYALHLLWRHTAGPLSARILANEWAGISKRKNQKQAYFHFKLQYPCSEAASRWTNEDIKKI